MRDTIQWLRILLAAVFAITIQRGQAARASDESTPRFQIVSQEEAWKLLPACEVGSGESLPAWARMLVRSLPRTTATMLEMDAAYRNSDELDPALRARLRWTAAKANQCRYGQQLAVTDMQRAGMDAEAITNFCGGVAQPAVERRTHQFVTDLTSRAYQVTDEQFAEIVRDYDERQTMAIVLQTAYADFQDRLLLTLGVTPDDEPLDPLTVKFATFAPDEKLAIERPPLPDASLLPEPIVETPADWTAAFSFNQLQASMLKQKARPQRISVPAWDDVQTRLLPDIYPVKKPVRINWSLSVLGHQPRLGSYWLRSMRTWYRESEADQVLNESVFWVVTRNLQCFY